MNESDFSITCWTSLQIKKGVPRPGQIGNGILLGVLTALKLKENKIVLWDLSIIY